MQDEEDQGIEVGDIRFDPDTRQTTFVFRKETDPLAQRWALTLDFEPIPRTMGILAQKKKESSMKLTTMIDQRVTCIVKNYKVDEKIKQIMFENLERKAVMEIEAPPLDQQAPIYIALNKNGQKQVQSDSSDEDDDGVKKIAKQFSQHKEPG